MNLSEHFTLKEAIVTTHNEVDNTLPESLYDRAAHTARCMEAVRAILGNKPIYISSWYRSPGVNRAVGGAFNSQHLRAEAVDFTCPEFGTPLEICRKLEQHKHKLGIDQLIYEGTWVHISFVIPPAVPRFSVLTYISSSKHYINGLPD